MREHRGAVSTQSAPAAAGSARAHAPNKWAALGVLACGLALIVLDGTIVGVSMPAIIEALDLDLAGAQWVTSLYSVVFAALLLTADRKSTRLNSSHVSISYAVFCLKKKTINS